MNQKYVKVVAIIIIAAMVLTSFTFVAFGATKEEQKYIDERVSMMEQYIKFIHDNYAQVIPYETLINAAYQGINDALDPFSVYYPAQEDAQPFLTYVDGTYIGIGIEFKVFEDGAIITDVRGGSPAYDAGLKTEDIIVSVDGKALGGLSNAQMQSLIMGEEGTVVKLKVRRDNTLFHVDITRKLINMDCLSYTLLDGGIAYVKMTGFDNDCDEEFARAKEALLADKASAMILDLRDNPGGYLDLAIDIADMILAKGDISHLEQQGEVIKSYKANDKESLPIDIIVLVNGNTASASEILSAALQENNAAKVVGTATYGKGLAQQVFNIKDGSALKLSVYYFLSPNKNPIHEIGVIPDYIVESGANETLLAQYKTFASIIEEAKPALGAIGLNVYAVQQRLMMIGYNVSVTGIMDENTVEAVKQFQKSKGLHPYGVADYTTMSLIDQEAHAYASGTVDKDAQLQKAIELLKNK